MATKDSKGTLENPDTVIRCESPPVAPLKHQHSFEQRYAALINKQILENTINKEVLHRQVQAFFPFSRSISNECQEVTKVSEKHNKNLQENVQQEDYKEEEIENSKDTENDVKVLQKLETLDIADKGQT